MSTYLRKTACNNSNYFANVKHTVPTPTHSTHAHIGCPQHMEVVPLEFGGGDFSMGFL